MLGGNSRIMYDGIKEQTLSGFKWNALGQFLPYAIQLIISLIIARQLEPEDYGVIGMLAIFMALAQAFVDSGFGNGLIRKIDRTDIDSSTVFYFNIAVACVIYLILFFSAPYIAGFFNMPVLTDVTRLLSLTIIINSIGLVPRSLLSIAVDFKSQAYASVVSVIISGVVGIYLALSGFGVWALVWQSLVSASVGLIIIWIYAKWRPKLVYSWNSFRVLFSFGSKLLVSRLINTIYSHLSSLIIGKYYSPADLGFYDKGYKIASLPSLRLSDALHAVTFPILAKLQDDDKRLLSAYHKYLAVTSLVIFFIMTLLAVIAKPLILLLLTEKWLGVVPLLQVFCLAFMFDSICRLNNNMLFVKGWSGLFLRLEIIKKVIIIPVLLLAIPLGVIAISFVAVIHTFVDIACSTVCINKYLDVDFRRYLILIKYFLLSALSCAPALVVCNVDISPWLSLPIGIISAIALYYIFLHKDDNMKEVIQTMGSMMREKR